MLNKSQLQLLQSFIGPSGFYIETIKDDTGFNMETKVLYLERAISQDCQIFLQSLDKLYNPALTGQAKTDHLNFIRALKFINDACFNNEVNYGYFGNRKALSHYFGSLGDIDTIAFQVATRKAVNDSVVVLQSNQKEITAQKAEWIMHEQATTNQTGWRRELDLPQAQLAMAASHAPLHQPHFFQAVQQPQRMAHIVPTGVRILVQMHLVPQETIDGLSYEQLERLDCTRFLISNGLMTVDEALALALNGVQHLHNLVDERIVTLIQEERLTIEQAKNFSDEQCRRVRYAQPLISNELMTVDEALALTDDQVMDLSRVQGNDMPTGNWDVVLPQLNQSTRFSP